MLNLVNYNHWHQEHAGQTGSGKTYTMGTAGMTSQSEAQQGIAPRLAADIFAHGANGASLAVVVSCLEIYGEELHDLLADNSKTKLKIREHTGGQIAVAGLREVSVSTEQDLLDVLGKGVSPLRRRNRPLPMRGYT